MAQFYILFWYNNYPLNPATKYFMLIFMVIVLCEG